MKKIRANTYDICIGNDALAGVNELIAGNNYSSVFILVDENTKKHCLKKLSSLPISYSLIQIKSREKNKNLRTCEKIWNELSKKNADRRSLLINLGGGVISDLGGFCASTYKRGIDFTNIPTTLLSQVDASVGGKTGIDFNSYKNQIGTFAFPKAVFIDAVFLKTLTKRELASGFAEVIKHGLIADADYWRSVRTKGKDGMANEEIISHSVNIKNEIVKADPFEKGLRKALNFGHTIGHAIESASLKTKKPLLHGEAIASGMICEAYISRKVLGLKDEELDEITSFIVSIFQPSTVKHSTKSLLAFMKQDKKNNNAEINFTLLRSIGKAEINNSCSEDLIEESIKFFNDRCIH